jgi:low affinity Fe/Cu permease
MTATPLKRGLTQLGVMTGQPIAFVIIGVYVVAWIALDRKSFDAHGIATLVTWLMTLFIQRAEHRDTQAIQAKLDELLRVQGDARNELTHLDEKEAEEIEAHREAERRNDPA